MSGLGRSEVETLALHDCARCDRPGRLIAFEVADQAWEIALCPDHEDSLLQGARESIDRIIPFRR